MINILSQHHRNNDALPLITSRSGEPTDSVGTEGKGKEKEGRKEGREGGREGERKGRRTEERR